MPSLTLDFPPACLTPLRDADLRALRDLTAGWAPPTAQRAVTASTMGPEAYRRLRLNRTATCVGYVLAMMVVVPGIVTAMMALGNEPAWQSGRALTIFYGFLAGGLALSVPVAAIAWHATGGKRRTAAGAEPATRLTFTATPSGLAIALGTGERLAGAWPRWRLSHVRSEVVQMRYSRTYHLNSVTLTLFPEDGGRGGSAELDPMTLSGGTQAAATIIGMICQAAAPTPGSARTPPPPRS